MLENFLLGLLFFLPVVTHSAEPFSAEPYIVACKACTPEQKARLVQRAGVRDLEPDRTAAANVYLLDESDNSVSRYAVASSAEYKLNEWRFITSVTMQTPEHHALREIHKGWDRYRDFKKKGINWESLEWGGYSPIASAHDVAPRDSGLLAILQGAVERDLNQRLLANASDLASKSVIALLASPKGQSYEIRFPDGTTIVVELANVKLDYFTDELMGLEVNIGPAMDGEIDIPTDATSATRLNWLLLEGEQLKRFIETARAYGLPVNISGSGEHMKCSWDGQMLSCIKSSG
ncbi:hypothetical protein [Permianibacter aggregans]|nr:hypothetical protein [Permianibacter aggregans]QGX40458.1 hypothetical protein E2H98_12580 [Permianibacter aggregans]